VGFSEELRRNAASCFRWAQEAASLEDRTAWLSMAQFWLQLAQYAEDQEAQRTCDASGAPKNCGDNSDNCEPTG
jgi:hypothetical protein